MAVTRIGRRGLLLSLVAAAGMFGGPAWSDGPASPASGTTVPGSLRPRAAAGFVLSEYATGFVRPVALLALPNGDLLVEEGGGAGVSGRALILRDSDRDGSAEQRALLLADLVGPAAWLLRRDRLYRAHAAGVDRCVFLVGQLRPATACRAIAGLDPPAHGGAVALAMYPDEARLLLLRGDTVVSLLPDGTALESAPAARGGRPLALALEPRAARPWVATASPASAGAAANDVVVRLEALEPDDADSTPFTLPGTPVALLFYRRRALPAELHGAALLALAPARGDDPHPARVVAVPFAAGRPAGNARDLLVGRGVAGAGDAAFEPTALAVLNDGAVVVADAASGTLWRLDYVP
ncbi:MAG: hypothetical protein U1F14_00135 [Steroidobacteraceae bacterium]